MQRKNLKNLHLKKCTRKWQALCSTECYLFGCGCAFMLLSDVDKRVTDPISSVTWCALPSFPVTIATSFFPFSYHLMFLKVRVFPPLFFSWKKYNSNTELSFPLDFRAVCCFIASREVNNLPNLGNSQFCKRTI